MSENLPDGWSYRRLNQIAKRITRRVSGKPEHVLTISSTAGFVDQRKKWARNMAGSSLPKYTELRKGEFAYNKGNSKTYPQGCVFRLDEFESAAVPNVYHSFKLTDTSVNSDYLQHFFAAGGLNRQLRKVITSSARANGLLNITADTFFQADVPLPSSSEQEKIATILTSVDEVIDKTESQISKLKDMKKGMMQELLTKGIGHTEFKDSRMGRIPCNWQTMRLGDVASLQRGHDITKANFVLGPYPVVSSSGISGYHNSFTSEGPNVLVGRKGSIGSVHFIESECWAHDTSLYVTNFHGNHVKFVYYLFTQLGLERFGTKSGSPSLNRNDVHPVKVAVPPLKEQKSIANILSKLDELIAYKMKLSRVTNSLKVGLMQDLLTGKVRVKVI